MKQHGNFKSEVHKQWMLRISPYNRKKSEHCSQTGWFNQCMQDTLPVESRINSPNIKI